MIVVERKLLSDDVLSVLTELFTTRGTPQYIRSDNGSEFTAKVVRDLLNRVGVKTFYSSLGYRPPAPEVIRPA